jgi:predicted nucleic acid-binding protein
MLTDTGPLVAICDPREAQHLVCIGALAGLRVPLVTLLPALVEAMYLLGRVQGWRRQEALWQLIDRGRLVLRDLQLADLARARELMRQYQDLPMDFADATLVSYAERENLQQIFTLDRRGFSTYRLRGRRHFSIVP